MTARLSSALLRWSLISNCFAISATSAVHAEPQPAPQAQQVAIVPPRLASASDVAYPEGAHGDAVVELTITVAKDGSVADVQVTTGLEPFSTAAADAARAFRFSPATRDGRAVPVKIRFEIRFTEPRPSEPAPSPQPAAAPPESPATEATKAGERTKPGNAGRVAAPPEVMVYGNRVTPGALSLGRAEVRQLPGAFGDPFRAIEMMPGVVPIVSGIPYFYIRGAPPGNVGYFLDGVRVPYLFHVALGPSVVHPAMVDRVDLYPGGYPAEFGRYAGGIVAAEATTPTPELHGEGNLRVFDAGALVEGGFANGRGTALVGGRYSYTAAIISLIAQDTTLDYRDYQARFTYDVGRDDRLSLLTFGAYDMLGQTEAGVFNVVFGAEFYRADLRWEHDLGGGGSLRSDVILGLDQTRIPNQPRNTRDDMATLKLLLKEPLSKALVFRAGTDVTLDGYSADTRPYSDPDDPTTRRFNALFPPRSDLAVGAWADFVLTSGIVELTPGVRVDVYDSGGASAVGVDPRISSRLAVARHVHVIHTLGLAHQPPSFTIPLPGLAVGSLRGGLQTAIESSAGVEVELPADTTATVTVADNVFLNMTDTLGVSQVNQASLFRENRSLGSSIGLELWLRRKLTQRLGGALSYTLSRSTRSVGSDHFPSSFDRTHVVGALVSYDLGRKWRAGVRVSGYTGTPSIPVSNGLVPPPRTASPPRDPAFYRIDLRLEKRWQLSQRTWLAVVAEVMNATLHKEVVLSREIGPVTIPSIGLEGGF